MKGKFAVIVCAFPLLLLLLLLPLAPTLQAAEKNFLSIAAEGSLQQVHSAIAAGADVNAKDKDGVTVLMWAAANNRLDSVKLLMRMGARVDAENSEGKTAYDIAVAKRYGNVADALFFKGSAFAQSLAYSFYALLRVLPFVSCALWLYRRYVSGVAVNMAIIFLSIGFAVVWGPFGQRPAIPVVKAIAFLLLADLALVWRWSWGWGGKIPGTIYDWPSDTLLGLVLPMIGLNCLNLTGVWTINPWTMGSTMVKNVSYLFIFVGTNWGCLWGWIIARRHKAIMDEAQSGGPPGL
jgi:hypothetical protein